MQMLSPTYRNDETEGLPEDVKTYLDEHFLKKLDNLNVFHPRMLVVFSGGNALGKTMLSQKIGQELGGLVLENDRIKMMLTEYDPAIDRETCNVLTWRYSTDLYKRLEEVTPNGLVVRDGVIDWYYDRILPKFEEKGYDLFVIAYEVSKEKRIELIRKRGDKTTVSAKRLIEMMDEHDLHSTRFRRAYMPDVVLRDENLFEHDKVIAKIQARLLQLNDR